VNLYLYPIAAEAIASGERTLFDLVGVIPDFLDDADPRDAVSQIDANYLGGWLDGPKGLRVLDADNARARISYPGDPDLPAIALWILRRERVILFVTSWVAVVQPDGSFRAARID
jgi:hypothetical protein